MGGQSSAHAGARPRWPQGEPPEAWGSDRGLQSTLRDGSASDLDGALLEAVADGDTEAAAALLAAGANVNHLSVEHDWASPAIVASQEGSIDCLKLLLDVRSAGGAPLMEVCFMRSN